VDHRPDVRCDVDVDGEAGIERAKVRGSPVVHEPEPPFVLRHVGEVEVNSDAVCAEGVGINAPADVPHQHENVEIVLLERILGVLHAPFAKLAKSFNIPVMYYIAPQLWASREGRIKKVRAYVDKLACIFPFEEPSPGVSLAFSNPLIAKTNPGPGSARVPACPLNKIGLAWIRRF